MTLCCANPASPNDYTSKSHKVEPQSPHKAESQSPHKAESQSPHKAESQQVTPPRLVTSIEAVYPPQALDDRVRARVELALTVLTDGAVGPVSVVLSGGQSFDESSIKAVKQWRFEPARQGGQAIESRIRVPFDFTPPPLQLHAHTAATTQQAPKETALDPEPSDNDEAVIDVIVRGDRDQRSERRSVSDFKIERDILAAAPRQEGAEVLRSTPGLYIGRGEGPAVAHSYMLRGFDADHGQDIEFHVGGLPINMPSHIHGQGYSDLGFLIGDVVQELQVTEGVYDPRQGDFAVAGSIDLSLGVKEAERGVSMRSSYGAWNTSKHQLLWAPTGGSEESFGAVQLYQTAGFGENRAGQSGSGLFQHRFGEGALTFRALGIAHAARSDLAGVVRRDDIRSGEVCFLCVYPYPTAKSQNALANRFIAGLFADYYSADGASGTLGFWLGYDLFRAQSNFTGFTQISQSLEREGGRGDLIEQQNRTRSMGLMSRYRTAPFRPRSWAHGTIEVGADLRIDNVDQQQNLLDASVRNQTWDQLVDASISSMDLGVWGDLDWRFAERLTLRGGARADLLSYEINDRMSNFAPLTRPQDSFISGYRRSALGIAAGPRMSAELKLVEWMSILAAYGQGYRSPQARQLEDGEEAPFSIVKSADLGARFDLGAPLQVSVGGFYTRLSDDIAFEADEGRLERIGATERLGGTFHAVTRPLPWLVSAISLTYIKASLLEPPPATAEEPQPPFVKGQSLPFIPPLVVRVDLGLEQAIINHLGAYPLNAQLGLGFSYLSSRPMPFSVFSEPVALLDVSAGLSWGALELSFELYNALNGQYAAVEYAFASDWSPNDGVRTRLPSRHISAGAPLSWMLSLGVKL